MKTKQLALAIITIILASLIAPQVVNAQITNSTSQAQVILSSGQIVNQPNQTSESSGWLHTQGGRIVDAQGNTVVLKGFNSPNTAGDWGKNNNMNWVNFVHFNETMMDIYAATGANVLLFDISVWDLTNYQDWTTIGTNYTNVTFWSPYVNLMNEAVQWCQARNIYVIFEVMGTGSLSR